MASTMIHICLETNQAPDQDAQHSLGERWVCDCGGNFVYHEGFNRGGGYTNAWFPAPALPRQRRSISSLLFGPRKG